MSMTKLTLSADKSVVKRAKRLADARETSLSAMVGRLLEALTRGESEPVVMGPITRRASGLIELPRARGRREQDCDVLGDALMEKYGLTR